MSNQKSMLLRLAICLLRWIQDTWETTCQTGMACFECDKNSKGNDKCAVYKHYRTQHERRHLHQCTFDTCSVDGHPFGNIEQYMVWWHMQDHGLHSPLGCPKCEGTFCKVSRNIFPLARAKRINLAPDRHHMQRKSLDAMSVQRIIHWRLHSCSTRKCTKALQRSICAASVVRLWVQPQPCTDMKKSMKIIKNKIKRKKPNSKFRTFVPDIYKLFFFGIFFWPYFLLLLPPAICLGNVGICLEYVGPSPMGEHMPWYCTLYLTSVQNLIQNYF